MEINQLKHYIEEEKKGIETLLSSLDEKVIKAASLIEKCEGKVIFLAVGKSAHIGRKLAATFSSTGTPSFFVHGTEACHGDLGMIEKKDVVILISNSGSTKEVTQNIAPIKAIGAKTIAFTSKETSPLAEGCDEVILIPSLKEADALNLAPTTSSTMTLVLGDAIACALSESKGFTRKDFYGFHPNGALGASLQKENL